MIWTFCDINLDAQPFKWFYFFAHTLEIISIVAAAVYGIKERKKSLIGFRVSTVLDYAFRLFLIAGFALCLYIVWDWAFRLFWGAMAYWRNDAPLALLATYCLSVAFGIVAISITIKYISKISLNAILEGIQILISRIPLFRKKPQAPSLTIDKAIYWTPNANVDVTTVLNKMILNNTLTAVASNDLAGDPDYGTKKILIVNYREGGVEQIQAFPEGAEIRLPLGNHTSSLTPFIDSQVKPLKN